MVLRHKPLFSSPKKNSAESVLRFSPFLERFLLPVLICFRYQWFIQQTKCLLTVHKCFLISKTNAGVSANFSKKKLSLPSPPSSLHPFTPHASNQNTNTTANTKLTSFLAKCLKHISATGSNLIDLEAPPEDDSQGTPKKVGIFRVQRVRIVRIFFRMIVFLPWLTVFIE